MTNSLQVGKKALTIVVAAATILWTVGLTAFVPVQASAASFGDLIKGETLSTVYYYGSDGQRYSFPNEKTYKSWYSDFSGVKTITDEALANITLAGNIVYRPGSRWVKITSDNKVYVVSSDGSVRWVESEDVAKGLAGDNWNQFIDDVPDVFFVDYTVGASLTSAAMGYDGLLWTDGTDSYLVSDGKLRKVSSAGLSGNGFAAGMTLAGTGFDKSKVTAGADVTGKLASLTDAAQKVTTDTYAATQDISVSLASSSPSASTLLNGQGLGHVSTLKFTNPTSSDVKVKKVSLKRTGVSSDTTLSNTYLFDGWTRLSDAGTLSSGIVSWNDATGLFTVPANGSAEVMLRSDIGDATGETVGLQLVAASDVTFIGSYAATGSFPLSGATHTIAAAPDGFTSVSFNATPTPSSAVSDVDPQEGYALWTDVVTVSGNEAYLHAIRFRNIGSINAADVENWKLYIDAVQAGSTVANQDANGYITFDLSAAPIRVKTGARTFKVLADIVGGTSRTITVSLHKAADAVFVDEDYNQADLVLSGSSAFSQTSAGAHTISTGDLTITKTTDSPSDKVVRGASSVTLGKWTLKASGESMKVENLRFKYSESSGSDMTSLRNGAVYADGSQIGSTATLNDDQSSGYTEYSFGSSLIVVPGTPVVVELRSDIFDNDGTDNATDGKTFTAKVDTGSSNVLRQTTGSYVSRPASAVSANQVEVDQGTLTVAKNTSFANQTMIDPKIAYKVGSYTVTASESEEDINITSLIVDFDGGSTEAAGDYDNAYLMYGPTGSMVTSVIKTTVSVADAGNTWNINYTLPAGTTMYVDVYTDVDSAVQAGETIITTLDLTATTVSSGQSADNGTAVTGQTITPTAGVFLSALDGSSPVALNVGGNQEITAAKYRFTAQNEDYTIKSVQLSLLATAASGGIAGSARIYDGDTLLGSGVFSTSSGDSVTNGAALISGLNIPVPAGTYKVLTGKLVLNNVGTSAATSQVNAALALDVVKAYDSQGALYTTAAGYTTDRDGREIRVYKSIPTVNHIDLTNTTVVEGQAMDLYKFSITAGSGGSIAIKQLSFPFTFSDGLGASDSTWTDTMEIESMKFYKNGSNITSLVAMEEEGGADVEDATGLLESDSTLYVIWGTNASPNEEVIAAGETVTYTLRGTPQDFNNDGDPSEQDTVSIYLRGDATHPSELAGAGTQGAVGVEGVCIDHTDTGGIWELGATASAGTACTTANTSQTAANFIWSDMSGAAHTSGETTSPDWTNGYLVLNLDLPGESWSK